MLGVLSSLIYVFELGLTPTLQRHTSFLYSKGSNIRHNSLIKLIQTSNLLYLTLGIIIILIINTFGTIILENLFSLTSEGEIKNQVWLFFLIKSFLYIHTIGPNAILQGAGFYEKSKKYEAIHFITKCFILIPLILTRIGLLEIIFFDTIITCLWMMICRLALKRNIKVDFISSIKLKLDKNVTKELIPSSFKWSGMQIGGYLINYSSSFAVSQLQNVEIIAPFLLTTRIVNFMRVFAGAPLLSMMPTIFRTVKANNLNDARKLFFTRIKLSLGIFIIGLILISITSIFLSKLNLLSSTSIVIYLGVMALLELHHGLNAQVYIATNKIPFYIPSILTGATIFILLISIKGMSILQIITIQFFTQLIFNNWYPTFLNLKLFNITISTYFKKINPFNFS